MKAKKALFLTTFAIIFANTAFSANPLIRQKYTADPNPFVWNDRLWVYCSYDNNNPDTSGYNIKFYTLISSDDMANWTDHGEVFSVGRDMNWSSQAYAPGTAVRDNKVYLYVPNGGSSIGVVYANRPEGPFIDPNKKVLISKNASMNTNVPWLFDPAAFIDSDGQAYLYFGGGDTQTGENLRVIKLNNDMTSTSGNAVTISGATRSFEAAYMHKYNGKYYFTYSQNFTGGSADIAYMMGDNPMTGLVYKGTMLPNGSVVGYGNNHTGVVQYKNNWYVFYHDRRLRTTNGTSNGEYRSVSVDKLEYNTDGTMKQVVLTTNGPAQIKNLNPYDTILATTIYKQSGSIKTAICSATGTVSNSNANSAGTAGDRCVMLTSITNGSWVSLKGVDFGTTGAAKFIARVASASAGGSIEIRTGSNTGALAGTCAIASTGGLTTWKDIECDVSVSAGVKDSLYLVFKGTGTDQFRLSKYMFKVSGSTPINVTCNVSNLDSSYIAGSNVPRPNVNCSAGEPRTAEFNIGESAIDGWNSLGGTHQLYNTGTRTVTLSSVECGSTKVIINPAISCGSFEIVPEITPIASSKLSVANTSLSIYYSLKGQPLGNAKPQKAGIYIVKQGHSIQKIVVR